MPGNPLNDPNWAPKLADTVERVVVTVRDKTTKPLLIAYRGLIFGVVGAAGAAVAVVLLLIAALRGLQALIGLAVDHNDAVWISYLGIGGLFCIAGIIAMAKRFPQETSS